MDLAEPQPLNASVLEETLRGQLIGSRVIVLEQTASSNDDTFRLGTAGGKEGLVVFGEEQTAARGQHGRKWESSPRKGLWFSILLRPSIELAATTRLTDWAAGAIAETVEQETGLPARIKPPNDVHIGDRKVAGVLVEMRAQPKQQPHLAIVGIGVNVSHATHDFPPPLHETATSLAIAKGAAIDRQAFAIALLRRLDASYAATFAP